MDLSRLGKFSAILIVTLLISACGTNINKQHEKIAVVNWEMALKSHPQYSSLAKGEKVLEDLVAKRKKQEELARSQLGSLQKLRSLRHISQQSYLQAELNTKLVELRERENVKLQKIVAEAETEANLALKEQCQTIENKYQLKLFHLRAVLETVKLNANERQAVELDLQKVQNERSAQLYELDQQKRKLVDAKVKPYLEEMQQRLKKAAEEYYGEMYGQLENREQKDQELLHDAPKALNNAISIMDREIDKQEEKNDKVRSKIKSDIESQTVKLAHEHGYTIVFNQVKANIKADDITEIVIKELKEQKNK